jgi:hypothetical protein
MLLLRGYVYSWGGYIAFYGVAVYFLMVMLTGVDVSQMDGRNAISIAMLIACISLYIILSKENKKIDLKPALCTLVISIWGVGRSGIISSFVLLLGLLFIRFQSKKIHFILIIFLIIVFLYWDALLGFLVDQLFFSNAINHYLVRDMGEYSDRLVFWTDYFDNLDIYRVIFGVNLLEDSWRDGAAMDYNYHNSFIHLHLQTGVMGLITMVLILFALFKYYRINKLFFFLMLSFILRAFTDLFIFFSRADFILFFFIFYFLNWMSSFVSRIKPISAIARDNSSP